MLLCWYKTGIKAMVIVIAFLAALGLHGSSSGCGYNKPCTMEKSQTLQVEIQL